MTVMIPYMRGKSIMSVAMIIVMVTMVVVAMRMSGMLIVMFVLEKVFKIHGVLLLCFSLPCSSSW
jgi:hypothetical protein